MANRKIIHVESKQTLIPAARWCNRFYPKLRGMTFRRSLGEADGLVLVERSDNRVGSGITMLFTFIDLGVLWVNDAGEIVDTVVARPWRPSYLPARPARYAIEGHPSLLEKVRVGEHIRFET